MKANRSIWYVKSLLFLLLLALSAFSTLVFANTPPDLTGRWRATDFQFLSEKELQKENYQIKNAIASENFMTAKVDQYQRFFILYMQYNLNKPIAHTPDKGHHRRDEDRRLCVIDYDNIHFYCIDEDEPINSFGRIISTHAIEIINMEHGDTHDGHLWHAKLIREPNRNS